MRSIEKQIGETLANESGGSFGFVCIWRKRGDSLDDGSDHARKCTVKEYLAKSKNQNGLWLIDGGWCGPPGPIHVRWNNKKQEWENGSFLGKLFDT